jgi:phosphoribosylformimino-5-aminoimidazole carboxamide ribotide isomerase
VRVIGVIDLLGGRAVRARGGNRSSYEPIRSAAGFSLPPGDALSLARLYVDELGVRELYVADLDAIGSRLAVQPEHALQNTNFQVVSALADLGVPLWLDAGVSSVDQARTAISLGASHTIVGLETLRSFGALYDIAEAIGRERAAFSLDLRVGQPIAPLLAQKAGSSGTPQAIAARAADAGAASVIVIDLARVGSGGGPDFDLMASIHHAIPDVPLLAGGGLRGLDDALKLVEAGCEGALVATALQDGTLARSAIRSVQAAGRQVSATR